jgi:hypothetical protein
MRDYKETIAWFPSHNTAAELGYNPNGMCLAIAHDARALPAMFPSAKSAQDHTPSQFRVTRVRDLRKGMVLYFDDPHDSNPFGHIVTMIGRVKGYDPDSLDDVLVQTNSVVSGRIVVVRASYFKAHWGDSFQFGAFWLNGSELDYLGWAHDGKGKEDVPVADHSPRVDNFRDSGPMWDVKILDRAIAAGRIDIKPKVHAMEQAVKDLPNDLKDNTRVEKFKEQFDKTRVLNMPLLNEAVDAGRSGRVKEQRDKINTAIKSVLRH